jgi:hypothetical protein
MGNRRETPDKLQRRESPRILLLVDGRWELIYPSVELFPGVFFERRCGTGLQKFEVGEQIPENGE